MKESLQYRRVDKAILNAFIKLSPRIPFEKMTVQDILDEALVSRYTFYAHFHDKYEVAERIQDNLYQEFLTFIEARIPGVESLPLDSKSHHSSVDHEIVEFCRQNYPEMNALAHIHTETVDFMRKLKDYFTSRYLSCYASSPTVALEAKVYAGMMTALMEHTFTDSFSIAGTALSQSIFTSNIRAMCHTIGMHREEDVQKTLAFLNNLLYRQ